MLSDDELKILAVFTMLIDHIGVLFFPHITLFRLVGRIAFPVFCFLISYSFIKTTNRIKLFYKLFIFAVLSEIIYDLFFYHELFYFDSQNIFFQYALCLLGWILYCDVKEKNKGKISHFVIFEIYVLIGILLGILSIFLYLGYEYIGVVYIWILLYIYENNHYVFPLFILILLSLFVLDAGIFIQNFIIIFCLIMGKHERKMRMKWVYLFYPIHLCILYGVWMIIGNV